MKKILFTGLLIFSVIMLRAQSPSDKIFDKYSGQEGFTTVYISKYMFQLFSAIEENDPEAQEMKEVISGLDKINILAVEDKSKIPAGVNIYDEFMSGIGKTDYKELMVIKEEGQDVKFLIREDNGMVRELILAVGGTDDNVIISIQGDIDLKSIASLSRAMDLPGMENLDEMNQK